MDKAFSQKLSQSMQSNKELLSCQENKCAAEKAKADAQAKQMVRQMKILVQKLSTKKLSEDEFKKQLNQLRTNAIASNVSKQLLQCALNECGHQLQAMMQSSIELLKELCKTDKPKCDPANKALAILKKKSLTVDDCVKILQLLSL